MTRSRKRSTFSSDVFRSSRICSDLSATVLGKLPMPANAFGQYAEKFFVVISAPLPTMRETVPLWCAPALSTARTACDIS